MTPVAFKEAQSNLSLTNGQIATVLGVSLRTVEKWRQGSRSIPGPVVSVLALLEKYKGASAFLLERFTGRHGPTSN